MRVRFVAPNGQLGAAMVVARTDTARASGFPVMARDGARLLVAYRDGAESARVHVAALSASELPRDAREEAQSRGRPEPASTGIGDPAARVVDAGGRTFELSEWTGEAPLVVAFFARWCQPCRDELAELERLRARLPATVRVVAVSLDEGPAARAEATARRWGFTGEVLRDAGAAATLGVPPLPGLFVFDREGRLRGRWVGASLDGDALVRALAR